MQVVDPPDALDLSQQPLDGAEVATGGPDDRRRRLRIGKARFPSLRSLEEFDFTFQPSPSAARVCELGELGFLSRAENVVFVGKPGVGKTHLAIANASLDEGDNDLSRFLAYLVATLRRADPRVGGAALSALRSPQPPPVEAVLTILINDAAEAERDSVLVLDDYHVVESQAVHKAVGYLLEHLPPQPQSRGPGPHPHLLQYIR